MPQATTIRDAKAHDLQPIKKLAVASGLFSPDEVAFFDEIFAGFISGDLTNHRWLVLEDDRPEMLAGAYFAPEPFADRMWNLYFIAVSPTAQGSGVGRALLEHIEAELRAIGEDRARTLIVETSSTDAYANTRTFYARRGFVEEARIRQFYGPADDKVVFWKSLVTSDRDEVSPLTSQNKPSTLPPA